jgi:putative heme iron utilization protein
MGWVPVEEYTKAEPDPLADAAAGILSHMNADHPEALVLLARAFAAAEAQAATMTSVDRFGFHLRLTQGERISGVRIGFLREARSAAEVRSVLVEMVHRAREL